MMVNWSAGSPPDDPGGALRKSRPTMADVEADAKTLEEHYEQALRAGPASGRWLDVQTRADAEQQLRDAIKEAQLALDTEDVFRIWEEEMEL